MEDTAQQPNILYSCSYEGVRHLELDPFVYEHALAVCLSGIVELQSGDKVVAYPEGSICLVRRNQLLKIFKKPANGKPFATIVILLSQEMLKKYSQEYQVKADGIYVGELNVLLENDAFMSGYFNSLMPYFINPEKLTPTLAQAKTTEVVSLLLRNPALKNFLFDFNEPHKIDLEAYMNKNFSYNIPLAQFARLTGRSLSTFKRDFAKIYNATPEKWLRKRRLEQAYLLLSQNGERSSDIYLNLGFESLSHFCYAFKKQYGLTPMQLRRATKESPNADK